MLKLTDLVLEESERLVYTEDNFVSTVETWKFFPKDTESLAACIRKKVRMPDGRVGIVQGITATYDYDHCDPFAAYCVDVYQGPPVIDMRIEFPRPETGMSVSELARRIYNIVRRAR